MVAEVSTSPDPEQLTVAISALGTAWDYDAPRRDATEDLS